MTRLSRSFQLIAASLLFLLPNTLVFGQPSPERQVRELLTRAASATDEASALADLQIARRLCRRGNCMDTLNGDLYHQLSVAYFRWYVDDDLAIAFADTAIHYYERHYDDDHPKLANEYYNRGVMQAAIGRGDAGLTDMTAALDRLSEGAHLSITTTDSIRSYWHQEIAKNYRLQRDFQLADDYANTGLIMAERRWSEPRIIKGDLLRSLGNVRYERNDYAEAITYYHRARKVYAALSPSPKRELLLTDQNLGLAYLALQDYAAAVPYLRTLEAYFATAYREKPDKSSAKDYADIHVNLLTAEAGRGRNASAERHFREALRLFDQSLPDRNHWEYAELYGRYAQLLLQNRQTAAARDFNDQAMAILFSGFSDNWEENEPVGPFAYVLQNLRLRADLLEEDGQLDAALGVYERLHELITDHRRRSLNGWSKYYLIADVVPVYEAAIRLSMRLFRETGRKHFLEQAYSFSTRNKAIVLREQLQHEVAIGSAKLPVATRDRESALLDTLRELDRRIARRPTPVLLDSLRALRVATQRRHTEQLRLLEHKYPRYYRLKYVPMTRVTSKEVGRKLAEEQVLVEYFSGQDSLYAFIITKDDLRITVVAQPEHLREDITQYHELMSGGITEDCEQRFLELAHRLYRQILARPLAAVAEKDLRRLLIIPDGLLHFVAFETLLTAPRERMEGSRDFLLERYACSYHYSSYFIVYPLPTPANARKMKRFGGFGAEYDEATLHYLQDVFAKKKSESAADRKSPCNTRHDRRYLGKLYHSDDEVKNIAQRLAGDYWLNEAVTKATFLREMDKYNILHLALHGSYDLDYPMSSALAFTKTSVDDALLSAGDIYALDLNCEMMVLSACNTSFGKLMPGEGVMTLARAFNYAGAAAVVASLWSLPDRSTSVIMEDFYAQLENGEPKDLALQRAKLNYLNNDNLSTPSTRLPTYWGATVVIGVTTPISDAGQFGPWFTWFVLAGLGVLLLVGVFYRRRR